MENLTLFIEFLLMDSSTSGELQILQGLLFLVIYMAALIGNLLTVTVIVTGPKLHSPMYFFLDNLFFIDLCCISVTVPKIIVNCLTGSKLISHPACAAQIFLFMFYVSIDLAFLVVRSHDHYVAICHPLHYVLTITPYLCTQAADGSWASGFIHYAIHIGVMFSLPFIDSNVIHQYFCDVPQILRISSSDVQFSKYIALVLRASVLLRCSALVLKSYIDTFSMVLRMHSVEACKIALATCTPQLTILIFFLISGLIAAFVPVENEASLSNRLTAVFYSMVPPFINSIIYSLGNREIKTALCRMFHRYFEHPRIIWIKIFLKIME